MTQPVPKSQLEVLNQLIDVGEGGEGNYRIRAAHRVHYVTIPNSTFDDHIMCRPFLLIPLLPDFPDTDWTTMHVSRNTHGAIQSKISYDPLPAIPDPWHPQHIDVLSLPRLRHFRSHVHEVECAGQRAIAKIALWSWQFRAKRIETRVYHEFAYDREDNPLELTCAPGFLGHLTENGRVIGVLLEWVEGESAGIGDLAGCEAVVRRMHALDMVHGDVNRYNFIVDRGSNHIRVIDFEHVENFDEEKARKELESLEGELREETGRGAPTVL